MGEGAALLSFSFSGTIRYRVALYAPYVRLSTLLGGAVKFCSAWRFKFPSWFLPPHIGVKEIGNSRFLRENAVFQRTTPHHVILNKVKDLSKTHRFG